MSTRRALISILLASSCLGPRPSAAQTAEDLLGPEEGAPGEPTDSPAPDAAAEPDRAPARASSRATTEEAGPTEIEAAPDSARPGAAEDKGKPELQSRKDFIKSVQLRTVLKDMRFELSAAGTVSVNDPLYLVMGLQGSGHFFVAEALSIGVGAIYFMATAELSGLDDIRRSEQAVPSVFERPNLGLDLELTWAPFYGKMSFLQDAIVHFDLYLIGGLGVVANLQKAGRPAMVLGIGQRLLAADWLTLKWELRDYVFNDSLDSEYGLHSDIQHYVMLSVGVGFFVPPSFSYTIR